MVQQPPSGPGPPHYRGFSITLGHTTLGRTTVDEWLSRKDTPDNKQYSQEADILAPGGIRTCNPSNRAAADSNLQSQTHDLDYSATGIGRQEL
jgi:hypothetical protein